MYVCPAKWNLFPRLIRSLATPQEKNCKCNFVTTMESRKLSAYRALRLLPLLLHQYPAKITQSCPLQLLKIDECHLNLTVAAGGSSAQAKVLTVSEVLMNFM